ncbi:unnamed protein product [Vitrella brassicaformis CCMP3155]|uniref:EGF-like domain-containing protein n=1 Tax=Vitrella brassicaformis (strain CCMP3155) TaxID=1169540 RepID=A0A0G4ERS3_VITBC|nr:unnamed protein product [Vitrella brassicaformis CCMP3155]|eukprot:CEM00909.1 unnamed protein product [Vitrella brassicaformis CCMP3155]
MMMQFNWKVLLLTAVVVAPAAVPTSGLANYGNWCGYSRGCGVGTPCPVMDCRDGVDCVCKEHDRCLNQHGYHKCGCDFHFMRDLPGASCSTPECHAYKAAALAVFQKKPCECRKKHCIPWFGGKKCWKIKYPGLGGKPNC